MSSQTQPWRAGEARTRRPWRFNVDGDDDGSEPEAMDEEEQEALITRLAQTNAESNERFSRLLLILPAAASLAYLVGRCSLQFSILALSSLAATAWSLVALPPAETGIEALDVWNHGHGDARHGATTTAAAARPSGGRGGLATIPFAPPPKSPLRMYLPLLNAVLCGLLVLAGLVGSGNGVVLGLLPALVYGTVLVAKTVMADVDPERELSVLKYEYKGA